MLAELEHPVEADVIGENIANELADSKGAIRRLQEFADDELEAIAAFLDESARRYADGVYDVAYRKAESVVRSHIRKA